MSTTADAVTESREEIEPWLLKEDVCRILGVKVSWLNTQLALPKEDPDHFEHIRLGKKKFIRFTPLMLERYAESKRLGTPSSDWVQVQQHIGKLEGPHIHDSRCTEYEAMND